PPPAPASPRPPAPRSSHPTRPNPSPSATTSAPSATTARSRAAPTSSRDIPRPRRHPYRMSSEQTIASGRTQQLEPYPPAEPPDPLAKITLTPRAFTALLAAVALLLGLILAIIPVHVTGPDPVRPTAVSCGNTIGGVESGSVAANLNQPDRPTMVAYLEMCE